MSSVYILPSAEDAPPAQVYFCSHVDWALAERSNVLRALTTTDGPACLPDSITRQEFILWARMDSDADPDLDSVSTMDVCTALRVADALGDFKTGDIALALGGRLLRTKWSDPDEGDAMMYTIHSLNHNLQYEVFSAIAGDVKKLMAQAGDWPISLQQAGVDAILASKSRLQLYGYCAKEVELVNQLLPLLSRSRLSSPHLSTFELDCILQTRAAACHLADALAHHTTLTSLTLEDLDREIPAFQVNNILISHAALATALSPIPQLSALTHLSISFRRQLDPHSLDTPPLVAALAHAVSGPRRLSALSLQFGNAPHPSSPHGASAAPTIRTRATLDPLLSAISAAPALTSLTLTADAHPLSCTPCAQPFQHLRCLELSPCAVPLAAPPCTATRAVDAESPPKALSTLTSITLTCDRAPTPSPALLEAFLAAVAPYQALQRLMISRIHISPHGPIDPHRALAPLRALSALTTLAITLFFSSTKPRALPHVAAALGQIPSLQHLSLDLRFEGLPRHTAPTDFTSPSAAAVEPHVAYPASLDRAFDPLLALVCLRSLQLSMMAYGASFIHAKVMKRLGTALVGLMAQRPPEWGDHMTQLELRTLTHRPLRAFARATAAMHALRDVDLGAVTVRAGDLAALAARMPGLTRLVLMAEPLDRAFVRRYAAFVATMPALVKMDLEDHHGTDALASIDAIPGRLRLRRLFSYITALPELPCRGRYRLPHRMHLARHLPARHARAAREMADAARSALKQLGASVDSYVTSIWYETH